MLWRKDSIFSQERIWRSLVCLYNLSNSWRKISITFQMEEEHETWRSSSRNTPTRSYSDRHGGFWTGVCIYFHRHIHERTMCCVETCIEFRSRCRSTHRTTLLLWKD